MASPLVRVRRWTRREYERLIDLGVFGSDERLELLDGALIVREPQNAPHAMAMRAVEEALRGAFGHGWDVRTQLPIALDDASEPEPDAAVVPGSYRDYPREHPSQPVLLVEISDATLASDRRKRGLYARARVEEFWILNLRERVLEVPKAAGVSRSAIRLELRRHAYSVARGVDRPDRRTRRRHTSR